MINNIQVIIDKLYLGSHYIDFGCKFVVANGTGEQQLQENLDSKTVTRSEENWS